ncbi:hypothetical protein MMC22_000292 [Lobaria immixta]|nr:hypothetical protein [Lobaria immixta]
MPSTRSNPPRLRSSAANHGHKPSEDLEDDDDFLMNGDDEDDEDREEQEDNEDRSVLFKKSLKMPPYEHAKRKLSQLIELMNGPYLDLAPHYQRGVVWTRKAMGLLIDSMWKGYYIPPVIFNLEIVEDEKGVMRYKRTCVDGKQVKVHWTGLRFLEAKLRLQRLTSIRDFMNGEFPCWIDQQAWYFCTPPPKYRKSRKVNILPDSARDEFKAIEVLCTEYKGLTQSQEIELFQRVQLGKPLTKAEAFRATQGSWQEHAKLYEKDFADVINLCLHGRASGFRTILVCFLQIYECANPTAEDRIPILRHSFNLIENFCSNAPAVDAATRAHLRFVFETFQELVEEDRSIFEHKNYTNRKAFSPIELIAIACLISLKAAERPKAMLRGDILALRLHLREVHSDIRLNKPCWLTAWRFIDTLEHHRGAVDRSTVEKRPPAPKIPKKKPQPDRSVQSFTAVNTVSQTRSAKASRTGVDENEQCSNAASRIPARNERREHDVSLNSPNNPPTKGTSSWFAKVPFPRQVSNEGDHVAPSRRLSNTRQVSNKGDHVASSRRLSNTRQVSNEGDHVASSRRLSNTPASVPSLMSSTALRGGSAAGSRRPSRLVAFKSTGDKSGSERATSQGGTISGSGTPLTPSAMSPTFGNTAIGSGSMIAPPARKRVALDLGSGSSGRHELEAKKARLMAGYVKQEKDG